MFETLAAISIVAGFVYLIDLVAGRGADAPGLTSLFANAPMPARPRGVQEMDLAPFAFPDEYPVATPSTVRVRSIEPRMDPARAA